MAESIRQGESSQIDSTQTILRLVEGEKSKPSITINFPGLEGTVLPSVNRLENVLLPILSEELLGKMIKYFKGVLVALPSDQNHPKVLLPVFISRQWRKDQNFQKACAEIGISLPYSIHQIRGAWFRNIVQFTKVPNTNERKYHTKTLGERMRRRLSRNEKRMLLQIKEFIQVLLDALIEEQLQRNKEIEECLAGIHQQIALLLEEKRSMSTQLVTSQRELFEERDLTEAQSSTRRQVDERIQKNRDMMMAAIWEIDRKIDALQKEQHIPAKKWRQRREMERKLSMVWESMRLRGELEEE